jgi:hypothetical protein
LAVPARWHPAVVAPTGPHLMRSVQRRPQGGLEAQALHRPGRTAAAHRHPAVKGRWGCCGPPAVAAHPKHPKVSARRTIGVGSVPGPRAMISIRCGARRSTISGPWEKRGPFSTGTATNGSWYRAEPSVGSLGFGAVRPTTCGLLVTLGPFCTGMAGCGRLGRTKPGKPLRQSGENQRMTSGPWDTGAPSFTGME